MRFWSSVLIVLAVVAIVAVAVLIAVGLAVGLQRTTATPGPCVVTNADGSQTLYAGTCPPATARPTPTTTLIPPVTTTPSATVTPRPVLVFPAVCQLRGPLPDPACTPGAVDPRVTQDNILSTICTVGYTTTVRPPTGYTTPLERELIRRYGLAGLPTDYELDHLISLELGGDPWDIRNLFPEPYEPRPGAREKDTVENALHRDVCAGLLTLAEAQRRIALDWTTARP